MVLGIAHTTLPNQIKSNVYWHHYIPVITWPYTNVVTIQDIKYNQAQNTYRNIDTVKVLTGRKAEEGRFSNLSIRIASRKDLTKCMIHDTDTSSVFIFIKPPNGIFIYKLNLMFEQF